MYTHLKERKYYEDLLDRFTVEAGRRSIKYYDNFFDEVKSKLKPGEQIDKTGNALILNAFYMTVLGDDLIRRYEEREGEITDMMARDAAKDEQIALARLQEEPRCRHCSKQGLRITDKSLMHRNPDHKYDDPEEVMFIMECPHCKKNSAFWEDGTAWKIKPDLCPKCSTELAHTSKGTKSAITITYTCPSCSHSYKEKLDMTVKKEKPDLDESQVEELRQQVVVDSVIKNGEIKTVGDKKFVMMANKFVNIDEISIDLIDQVNPFQKAFEILSKSVTTQVLKVIQDTIASTRIEVSEDEAFLLWPKIKLFVEFKGHRPDINSHNELEKRMAEVLLYLQRKKQEAEQTNE